MPSPDPASAHEREPNRQILFRGLARDSVLGDQDAGSSRKLSDRRGADLHVHVRKLHVPTALPRPAGACGMRSMTFGENNSIRRSRFGHRLCDDISACVCLSDCIADLLAQRAAQYLSGAGLRQVCDEIDPCRHLVGGKRLAAMAEQFILVQRRLAMQHDERCAISPFSSSGSPATAITSDRGAHGDHLFELSGIDIVAGSDDHVLLPVDDEG